MPPNHPDLPPDQVLTSTFPTVGELTPAPEALDTVQWRLHVDGLVEHPMELTLEDVLAIPRRDLIRDIHCVTGWSHRAMCFTGFPLAELLQRCPPLADARFVRFVAYSDRRHDTSLPLDLALADTWLVTHHDGHPLTVEHGFPLRTVTPSRYFYKSIKWLHRIELLADDRLGFWERESAYHNNADPWQSERYDDARITPEDEVRRFRDATSFDAYRDPSCVILKANLANWTPATDDLVGLQLKACRFRSARLAGVRFDNANLTRSDFLGADLRGTRFIETDLEGVSFVGADLSGAVFENVRLSAATFTRRARDGSSRSATVTGLELRGAHELLAEQLAFLRASDAAVVEL